MLGVTGASEVGWDYLKTVSRMRQMCITCVVMNFPHHEVTRARHYDYGKGTMNVQRSTQEEQTTTVLLEYNTKRSCPCDYTLLS